MMAWRYLFSSFMGLITATNARDVILTVLQEPFDKVEPLPFVVDSGLDTPTGLSTQCTSSSLGICTNDDDGGDYGDIYGLFFDSSSYFVLVEKEKAVGATPASTRVAYTVTLTWEDLVVDGLTDLKFSGSFLRVYGQSWKFNDVVKLQYKYDMDSEFTDLFCFRGLSASSVAATSVLVDEGCLVDGESHILSPGDEFLPVGSLTSMEVGIPSPSGPLPSVMDFRVFIEGFVFPDEGLAFDDFKITGMAVDEHAEVQEFDGLLDISTCTDSVQSFLINAVDSSCVGA